ncbi:AcrR family transcriptional regulator [Kibdelosporangium banguiense]|uniref:AcrR family transcriptional regulator n=1 Tax=Kibdelosporangium banguiense TaxID=1365924 RepID=A0ABS4TCB7_9PSEU|nr:TetR/AcrR family transcriptional regulator [Kibdelosporangium banguiense]MBP2321981.1 AcrR family transcriptional regulator [Kibdelosporangium banguiense]
MGHRDELLAGAKRCLYERGYAHTTARDIVAASGTNLASIGYHFGSKEALLFAAMSEAMNDWAVELSRAIATTKVDQDAAMSQRLESAVTRLVDTLAKHRPLWVATYEILPQIERSPELRAQIAAAYEEGRRGLAALLLNVTEEQVGEEEMRTVGSLFFVLISGLITQWLVDPQRAPNADDLMRAMRMTLGNQVTHAIPGAQ